MDVRDVVFGEPTHTVNTDVDDARVGEAAVERFAPVADRHGVDIGQPGVISLNNVVEEHGDSLARQKRRNPLFEDLPPCERAASLLVERRLEGRVEDESDVMSGCRPEVADDELENCLMDLNVNAHERSKLSP